MTSVETKLTDIPFGKKEELSRIPDSLPWSDVVDRRGRVWLVRKYPKKEERGGGVSAAGHIMLLIDCGGNSVYEDDMDRDHPKKFYGIQIHVEPLYDESQKKSIRDAKFVAQIWSKENPFFPELCDEMVLLDKRLDNIYDHDNPVTWMRGVLADVNVAWNSFINESRQEKNAPVEEKDLLQRMSDELERRSKKDIDVKYVKDQRMIWDSKINSQNFIRYLIDRWALKWPEQFEISDSYHEMLFDSNEWMKYGNELMLERKRNEMREKPRTIV